MGRFTVNEKYVFISQSFMMCGDLHFLYEPWADKNLNNEIIVATCISEHGVPMEYSDAKGTGYIFSDQHGRIWYNQYPTASYGQLDDSGDRQLILHDENIANVESYRKHIKANQSNLNDDEMIHDWYFWKARPITLQSFVDSVFRFVITNNEIRRKDDEIRLKCNVLEDYLGELISEVEKEGCEVSLVTRMTKFLSKKHSEPKFFLPPRVTIVWKAKQC